MLLNLKKINAIFIILALLIASTGCDLLKKNTEPDIEQQNISLYYVSEKESEQAEGENPNLILYEDESISYPKDAEHFGSQGEMDSYKYNTVVSMLDRVPEDLNCEEKATTVTKEIEINNIVCKDGTAYVDVKATNLQETGGSTTEILYISQITETLVNSFPEVERVKFMVDGKESDTLMGHCDITEPFEQGLVEKVIVCR